MNLPIGHLDRLIRNKRGRVDHSVVSSISEAPPAVDRPKRTSDGFHEKNGGYRGGLRSDLQEEILGAWAIDAPYLQKDKEQLITKTEG
jgi:hypothetical protein